MTSEPGQSLRASLLAALCALKLLPVSKYPKSSSSSEEKALSISDQSLCPTVTQEKKPHIKCSPLKKKATANRILL